MKTALLLTMAVVALGCDQSQTVGQCGDGVASNCIMDTDGGVGGNGGSGGSTEPGNKPDDPCAPYGSTILPSIGVGDVLAICSASCGDTCESLALGDSCDAYGATCSDVNGEPGICITCCAGTIGELRCGPLH